MFVYFLRIKLLNCYFSCKNLNSPPTGIWPQTDYTKLRRPEPPPNFDSMGFPEQMKLYTDPNFLFNVPLSQDNGNSPDNILQVC